MNTELYANHIRSNIRRALKQAVEMQATLLRSQAVEDPFAVNAPKPAQSAVSGSAVLGIEDSAPAGRASAGEGATAAEAAPSEIGTVRGYRYIKRNDAMQLGLTGELADSFDTEWFVDFEQSTEIRRGDHLRFGDGDTRRVCSVRGGVANIYKLYRLEVA